MKHFTSLTKLLITTLTLGLISQLGNAELVLNDKDNGVVTQKSSTSMTVPAETTSKIPHTAHTYTIDPNHGNVRFAIDHFGTTTNHGGFYGITGDLEYNPAKRIGAIDVIIPIKSLETGNEHFTHHLLTKDFFNVEQYPTAEFKSTKFYFNGDKVSKVTGNLTLLGKTNPVTLTATKFNCYNSPMLKTQVCGGDFETTIDRTQWGMDSMVKMGMSKNVKLTIQVEASKN